MKNKNDLLFDSLSVAEMFKIYYSSSAENLDESKASEIDNLSGIFLKDGAPLIATPTAQLCNLSTSFSRFPDASKIAKPKQLFKKMF